MSCKDSPFRGQEAAAHLHLKIHTQKRHVFASTQKGAFTAWYNKLICGVF